ncbi:MAG: hypothetical protein WD314_15050 [Trueperaceae bacterium]
MESAELLAELRDRHSRHLVYEGPYRLQGRRTIAQELTSVLKAFEEWRQRIYRFENRLGASVVLYQPINRRGMRWDLIKTRFPGDDPFSFHYQGGIANNLSWREVQRILDGIRED